MVKTRETYIALFRGINVGGHNILPMRELVAMLTDLRCSNVQTYIQSGNAVFQHDSDDPSGIADEIRTLISERKAFRPDVQILNRSDWQTAVAGNPYNVSAGKTLHFYFLASVPPAPDMNTLDSLKSASEEFHLEGKVFYLHTHDGIGRSRLAAKVERCLGVPATARNWNTVNKLSEMARSEQLFQIG